MTHAAREVQADVGDISRIIAESVVDKIIHADELARIESASKAAQCSIQRLTETSRYLHHARAKRRRKLLRSDNNETGAAQGDVRSAGVPCAHRMDQRSLSTVLRPWHGQSGGVRRRGVA
ncbi:hypothetical protein OVY01_15190 [Robbsia sp. Bb-Pol-6]|uniref:Uncharacterized protein n=1 Tax=Robbsia betulipollinis TaxID=2981849 RepID=A0ABT3ZRM0_9BURK|nr:hypothetical protein [Robbsia betulipollinis]MCY0388533.1 hypothetical protein [Robbsia betulipollinis]